jgi:iron(III) transport system ATP-binding protein
MTIASRPGAVVLEKVSKRFNDVVAVAGVDLAIVKGTLVTLLGPSGCGKTTTLRLIAGLEVPSSGRVQIGGRDVTMLPPNERDVSMVFQSYALFPHMTVIENVSYGLRPSKLARSAQLDKARAGLKLVGLEGYDGRLPSELSGGQQQRVAVARALVLEPQVLLFDEPLSNLDAKLRRRMREDIRDIQLKLGLTAVYVTHDQEEALAVSDRIIVMNKGVIVQQGTPRDLYERPADAFIADFIGSANLLAAEVVGNDRKAKRMTLRVGDATLAVPRHAVSGNQVYLVVRPGAVSLQSRPGKQSLLPAIIEKATYLGSHWEYTINAAGHSLFVTQPPTKHFDAGSTVYVDLELEHAAIVQR